MNDFYIKRTCDLFAIGIVIDWKTQEYMKKIYKYTFVCIASSSFKQFVM